MVVTERVEILVVGGGIIGCSAAAFAAEQGASVRLLEANVIGAGASGRNSGAVQHPFDPILADLHRDTLAHYRDLAGAEPSFRFPDAPSGLLLLGDEVADGRRRADELSTAHPELAARYVATEELRRLEPALAEDLVAVRLETGYPIPPDAATRAMADRARRAGADLREGSRVVALARNGDRVTGVLLESGDEIAASAVLLAAGPWTPGLVPPEARWSPLRPTHGVTAQVPVALTTHLLEEGMVHTVNRPVEGGDGVASPLNATFSLVRVGETSTVGSTFAPAAPDPERVAPQLVQHGGRFVPALRTASVIASRVCARPQSIDGRPFIGPLAAWPGLFVCVGHGPWGISTGPASAASVVRTILDEGEVVPELRADRRLPAG